MEQSPRHRLVFLFDVDNTLLDNDRVTTDLHDHLEKQFGPAARDRYFAIFEELRSELGYADYLGALQRYRVEHPREAKLLAISSFLIDYPFAERLYPHAIDAVNHCKQFGPVAILSDGDVVFQPRKVVRSGLWSVFGGNVLIYIHKEEMLDDVERRFPSDRYVLVDDKLRILNAVKKSWTDRLTTVFPKQGHYASDLKVLATYPPADISIDSIGDLVKHSF